MRTEAACTIIVLVASSVGVCQAQDLTLTRAAQSGVARLLGYERSWDGSCQAVATQVTITAQPAHGSVSVVVGESVIPATTPRGGSTGSCAGQPIVGKQVMYRSEAGYRGTDHVSWSVVYGNGRSGRTEVTVIVQ